MKLKEYTIQELSQLLNVSTRTLSTRISKLHLETLGSIRKEVKEGNISKFIYNEKALQILSGKKPLEDVKKPLEAKTSNPSQLDNKDEIIKLKDDFIKQLKEENQYLKDQLQQIQHHQNNIELAYADSTKYIQSLLENQQKITMDLQQKIKLIEAPAPKKKGWFK